MSLSARQSGFWAALIFLTAVFFNAPVFGFSFLNPAPAKKDRNAKVSKTADYFVLFFLTGESKAAIDGPAGPPSKELGYKFFAERPESLFGEFGWIEMQFLDKKGEVTATDVLSIKDLNPHHEYYSFIWVEPEKASRIDRAAIRSMNSAQAKQAEEKKSLAISQNNPKIQDVSLVSSKSEVAAQTALRVPLSKPKAENTPITNEEIQQALKELEQKKATVIPESPDKILGAKK